MFSGSFCLKELVRKDERCEFLPVLTHEAVFPSD
jgi:hypothetical protein